MYSQGKIGLVIDWLLPGCGLAPAHILNLPPGTQLLPSIKLSPNTKRSPNNFLDY